MDRRSQTEHIRAAREWLGRAEDSLAQENDVQGDLKLMLAKAELAHVGHCPGSQRLLVWGRRTLALLVAVGLAAAILWKPAVKMSGEEIPFEYAPAAGTQSSTERDIPVESNPEPQSDSAAETPAAKSLPQPSVPEPAPSQDNVVKEAAPSAPPTKKNMLPDTAKQKLMQSAGKILRQ